MHKKVVVVGAGWLGEALGQKLLDDDYQVQMTSRDRNKATQPHWALFNCEDETTQHTLSLQNAIWLFCIPAGRTTEKQAAYGHYLKSAIALAKQLNMRAFILCSTTGVYADTAGIYRESDPITAQSDRQARLLKNEAQVIELADMGKVLRLAGLFGPKRHPGRFCEHKKPRSNGAETVNLIHQRDVIQATQYIIEHIDTAPPILNLVMPEHPTKAEFYQQAAQALNLPAPEFENGEGVQRIISSQLLTEFGYQFKPFMGEY